MGLRLRLRLPHKSSPRTPSYLLLCVLALSFFSFTALLLYKVLFSLLLHRNISTASFLSPIWYRITHLLPYYVFGSIRIIEIAALFFVQWRNLSEKLTDSWYFCVCFLRDWWIWLKLSYYLLPCNLKHVTTVHPVILRNLVSLGNFVEQVDDFVAQTKTLAGHNLEPTPWHVFPRKSFSEATKRSQAYRILQCSYFSCPYNPVVQPKSLLSDSGSGRRTQQPQCPDVFRFVGNEPISKWVIAFFLNWSKPLMSIVGLVKSQVDSPGLRAMGKDRCD